MNVDSILVSLDFGKMRNTTGHQSENRRQQDRNNYFGADVFTDETVRMKDSPFHWKHFLIFCLFLSVSLYVIRKWMMGDPI